MIPFIYGAMQKSFQTTPAVMVNGDVLFTITGGPIRIEEIVSTCVTANGATASTLQYSSTPTVGSATTISGASASLANATEGTNVRLAPTALSTAPVVTAAAAGGVSLGTNVANRIVVKEGTITAVIGTGSTTGTWKHAILYTPLTPDSRIAGN